ncbi:hypothetical protein PROAA_2520006 [Candidatus Propionivibrio aalborgensis]|uniref:Uncharacterized protein n=1 Tax=Candidatus Propionivibrio aalborgensis TaxID=1860101 RepID=A0A1A8XSF4_9RHOO|nr:hypothetical protein PROAA_2520006 [Candidatus Propionivibrio aalborgensis]
MTTGAGGFLFCPSGVGEAISCMYCEIRNMVGLTREDASFYSRRFGPVLTSINRPRIDLVTMNTSQNAGNGPWRYPQDVNCSRARWA